MGLPAEGAKVSTHPVRYVHYIQCHKCNSSLRQEAMDDRHITVACDRCEVLMKIPTQIVQAEVIATGPDFDR